MFISRNDSESQFGRRWNSSVRRGWRGLPTNTMFRDEDERRCKHDSLNCRQSSKNLMRFVQSFRRTRNDERDSSIIKIYTKHIDLTWSLWHSPDFESRQLLCVEKTTRIFLLGYALHVIQNTCVDVCFVKYM